jgi:hypothetical protein
MPDAEDFSIGAVESKPKPTARGSLSVSQIADTLRTAGWAERHIPTMTAIAQAESSGNPLSHNAKYPDDSYGLLQVNRLAHPQFSPEQLRDPVGNAKAALDVFNRQGLRAWSTYTNGAYKKHLGQIPAQEDFSIGAIDLSPDPQASLDPNVSELAQVGAQANPALTDPPPLITRQPRVQKPRGAFAGIKSGAGPVVRQPISRADLERPVYESQRGQPTQNPTNIDLRVLKGEQPLDRVAYQREGDLQNRAPSEPYRNRVAREQVETDWRTKNQPEIDRQTQLFKQDIQRARQKGADANKWLAEFGSKAGAGLTEFGAGVTGSDTLRIKAEAAQRAAQEEGANRGAVSKFIQDVGAGFISSVPELAAMSVGVPAPLAFGAGSGVRARGSGRDVPEAVVHGALTGAAFEVPGVGQGVTKALTRAGGVGAASTGIELASGASPREAAVTGLTNATMVGVPEILGGRRNANNIRQMAETPIAGEAAQSVETGTASQRPERIRNEIPRTAEGVSRPPAPDVVANNVEPKAWQHRDFGKVVEAPQQGVGQGRVRVVDESGSEHVIKRAALTGKGNNIAIPVKSSVEPADTLPVGGETGVSPSPQEVTPPEGKPAKVSFQHTPLEQMGDLYNNKVAQSVRAFEGDQEVGRLIYTKAGYPLEVFVEPKYRRQGIATKLYAEAEKRLGQPLQPGSTNEQGAAFRQSLQKSNAPKVDTLPVREGEKPFTTRDEASAYLDTLNDSQFKDYAKAYNAANPTPKKFLEFVNQYLGRTEPSPQEVVNPSDSRSGNRKLDRPLSREAESQAMAEDKRAGQPTPLAENAQAPQPGSVLSDEQGKPITLYRGIQEDRVHDQSKLEDPRTGIYLTSSESHARLFGEDRPDALPTAKTEKFHAKLKNPLVYDAEAKAWEYWLEEEPDFEGTDKEADARFREFVNERGGAYEVLNDQTYNFDSLLHDLTAEARKSGNDGLVVDFGDLPTTAGSDRPMGKVVVVWRPETLESLRSSKTQETRNEAVSKPSEIVTPSVAERAQSGAGVGPPEKVIAPAPEVPPVVKLQPRGAKVEEPPPLLTREPVIRERSFPKTLEASGREAGNDRHYEELTDKAAVEKADARIAADPQAAHDWVMKDEGASKEKVATGLKLADSLVADAQRDSDPVTSSEKHAKALDLYSKLASDLTTAGQTVQAASLAQKYSPSGALLEGTRIVKKTTGEDAKLPVEHAKILTELANKHQEAEQRIAALETQIAELRQGKTLPRGSTRVKTETIVTRLESKAELARKRIAETKARMAAGELEFKNTGPVPGHITAHYADYVTIGAEKIVKGGIRFGEWSSQMVRDLGEEIKPYLNGIYRDAYKQARDERLGLRTELSEKRAAAQIERQGAQPSRQAVADLLQQKADATAQKRQARVDLDRHFRMLESAERNKAFKATMSLARDSLLTAKGWLRIFSGMSGKQAMDAVARIPETATDIAVSRLAGKPRVSAGPSGMEVIKAIGGLRNAPREMGAVLRGRPSPTGLAPFHEGPTGNPYIDASVSIMQRLYGAKEALIRSVVYPARQEARARVFAQSDSLPRNQIGQRAQDYISGREEFTGRTKEIAQQFAEQQADYEIRDKQIIKSMRDARIKELVNNPSELIHGLALQDTARQVYATPSATSEALARVGSSLKAIPGAGPAFEVGRTAIMPFAKRPSNSIADTLLTYTGLKIPIEGYRMIDSKFSAPQREAFNRAVGRGMTAYALIGLGAALNKAGLMTGVSDKSKNAKRARGYQDGSLYIQGRYYQVTNVPIVGWLLGIGATMSEEGPAAIPGALAKMISEHPLLRGIKEAADMAKSSIQAAQSGDKAQQIASSAGGQLVSRLIPSPVAMAAEAIDTKEREKKTGRQQFEYRIPGLRQTLPAMQNVFGQDVSIPRGSVVDPFRSATSIPSPGADEVMRLKMDIGVMKPKDGESRGDFAIRQKASGIAIKKALDQYVQTPQYKALPEATADDIKKKQQELRELIQEVRHDIATGGRREPRKPRDATSGLRRSISRQAAR